MKIPKQLEDKVIHINGVIIHFFDEDGENWTNHIFGLECRCEPTPLTISKDGEDVVRCLRHHHVFPSAVFPKTSDGNMQLTDNEGSYIIQDAARTPSKPYKGTYTSDTARLLKDQLENMYELKDLKNVE